MENRDRRRWKKEIEADGKNRKKGKEKEIEGDGKKR